METASHLIANALARGLHIGSGFFQLLVVYLQVNKNLTCLHIKYYHVY
jgi:hypothetical protein